MDGTCAPSLHSSSGVKFKHVAPSQNNLQREQRTLGVTTVRLVSLCAMFQGWNFELDIFVRVISAAGQSHAL
jgi:hypothetical protein